MLLKLRRVVKIPLLKLPDHMRRVLSKPLGTLIVSSKGVVKGLELDYSVGDFVSRNHRCRYRVVDGKTLRTREFCGESWGRGFKIINPRGAISLNAFTMLKARGVDGYYVVGEEDLLVLPINREYEAKTIYGQPNVGVVVYNASRFYTANIIKSFKPDICDYELT